MPNGKEFITAIESTVPKQTSFTTTLYDLMAGLNAQITPDDDDRVTATVVYLCNAERLRFRGAGMNCNVICA